MKCAKCGKPLADGAKVCSFCGATANIGRFSFSKLSKKECLKVINLISIYKGEPTVGVAEATGTLTLWNNCMEYSVLMGNTLASSFGVVGLLASKSAAVKKAPLVFYYSEIRKLREGKYMGIYNTLVVEMTNGEKYSFVPSLPASTIPKECIALIHKQMEM